MAPTLAELALRLNRRHRRRGVPPLVLMTDPRLSDPLAVARRLPPGCAVVLRHYDRPERQALGRALARLCRERRLAFLVAADVALAVALHADGLHLPEGMRRPPNWRGMLSAAAHSRMALGRAQAAGADWALLSPVFATASHPGARPLGPWRFAALARTAPLPVLALGGVSVRTVRRLRGAAGIATVGNLGVGR